MASFPLFSKLKNKHFLTLRTCIIQVWEPTRYHSNSTQESINLNGQKKTFSKPQPIFWTYCNWKSHAKKSWRWKQNACFISYRCFQTQAFRNGTQCSSMSSWKNAKFSVHMCYFLLEKWYYSLSIICYSSIHCHSTATRYPQSFYWGWWLNWAYSGQMESSPVVATTFNVSSLNIPNERLQANSEELLERRQQACCYYQGSTHCSILRVRSPKSCMSLLPIYLGQNFLKSLSLELRASFPTHLLLLILKWSLSRIQQTF